MESKPKNVWVEWRNFSGKDTHTHHFEGGPSYQIIIQILFSVADGEKEPKLEKFIKTEHNQTKKKLKYQNSL